ncbi:hypothetical protein JCM6882_002204 [Rhodosporidiobolus microsporus]
MDRLPDETVLLIAEFLRHDDDVQAGQQSLAKLNRLSKRYHTITTTLLWTAPLFASPQQAERWGATYGRWATPFKLCELKQGKTSLLKPTKLSFHYPFPALNRDPNTGAVAHWTHVLPAPTSRPGLSANIFSSLSSLTFINCDGDPLLSDLLGPGQPLRSTLQHLVIRHENTHRRVLQAYIGIRFCLEYLEYTDRELSTHVLVYRGNRGDSRELHAPDDRWDYDARPANEAELRRAHHNLVVFSEIHDVNLETQLSSAEAVTIRAQPPSSFPFFALQTLEIWLDQDETAFTLIFSTSSFPSLKRFAPHGNLRVVDEPQIIEWRATLRYSITRATPSSSLSHGVIHPPKQCLVNLHLFSSPATKRRDIPDKSYWTPLSPQERDGYAYGPYRGPELEVLDLSNASLMLVGWE